MTLVKLLFATALFAAPLALTGCETTAQAIHQKEGSLKESGFVDRPANTPAREAMLAKLPSHKFLRRTRGTDVRYIYADPTDCHCLYVGSQQAYSNYKTAQQLKRKMQEMQNAYDESSFTVSDYDDPSWAWGEWGSFGPDFGWEPGLGW